MVSTEIPLRPKELFSVVLLGVLLNIFKPVSSKIRPLVSRDACTLAYSAGWMGYSFGYSELIEVIEENEDYLFF